MFVLPEDLVIMDSKAVLAVMAALMTLHYKEEHPEEFEEFAAKNEDDEVFAELSKVTGSG